MIELDAEVAVIGAGFGGSLTALLLERIGLKPVLIERGSHPRFALGESSTPLADLVLSDLADRYRLPRLKPLANYGTWQETYPELVCGLKRGFSYFQHQPGKAFAPRDDHAGELLVAASYADADADAHWLRADFDHFIVREAQAAGVPYFDRTELSEITPGERWRLVGRRGDEPCRFDADFLIDATGNGDMLARRLGLRNDATGFLTSSRTVYGHFVGVKSWRQMLHASGGCVDDHPYRCDDAALHHVMDGGWMWVLPFNNGVTSAGLMFEADRYPFDPSRTPRDEWQEMLARHPSVAAQFADAQLVAPEGGLRRTARLQRRVERAAGPNWAMLPQAAYTLDALHSTGNAHTLYGIERIVGILQRNWKRSGLAAELERHNQTLQSEIALLDKIVHGCYLGFGRFELLVNFAMCYFAGATTSEARRRRLRSDCSDAFLQATNPEFRAAVDAAYDRVKTLSARSNVSDRETAEFARQMAHLLEPFNIAGLCDPAKRNMYPFTG